MKRLKPIMLKSGKKGVWIILLSMIFHSAFPQINRPLAFATYIGGAGNNIPLGLGITTKEQIVVAGNFDSIQKGTAYINSINLMNGADSLPGKLLLFNASTGNIETILNLGTEIYDFDMAPGLSNNALVAGNFGIALIDLINFSVVWDTGLIYKQTKISISKEGECAVLFSANIYHLSGANGSIVNVGPNPYDVINDITIIQNRIFVTGVYYKGKTATAAYCSANPGPVTTDLTIAFVDSYIMDKNIYLMTLDQQTWGFKTEEMNCDIGITRGLRIEEGQDGLLYFLGETYHAENIFKYNGKTTYVINGNQPPPTTYIGTDAYNSLENTGSATVIGYFAKINPNDGTVLSGQFVLSRNDSLPATANNDPYNVRSGAISTDEFGNIYVGGMAGNSIQNRNNSSFGGVPVAPYAGGDPALLITSSSFNRQAWQVFTGLNGMGTLTGIAVSPSNLVVLGRLDKGNIVPYNAVRNAPYNPSETDGKSDVFLAVWKKESVTSLYQSMVEAAIYVKDNSIDLNNIPSVVQVEISNIQGKLMSRITTLPAEPILLSNYSSGVYIIRISTPEHVLVKKIYIE
jgi:hypothetical protein